MAEIVLSTVDLDVFGGPTSLDVSVDFGAQGVRGSRFWAGANGPTVDLVGQDVELYDVYLNTNTGVFSQYILQVGSPTWTPLLDIDVPQYSLISATTFTAGSGSVTIPISSLTSDTGTTASDYVIRYNISNTNPVASSFTSSIVSTNIVVTLNAIEYSGGSWSNLSGSKNVHLFISYIG
jgi:hypothetical protein